MPAIAFSNSGHGGSDRKETGWPPQTGTDVSLARRRGVSNENRPGRFSWSLDLGLGKTRRKLKSDLLVLVQPYPRLGIYVAHFGTGQSWS